MRNRSSFQNPEVRDGSRTDHNSRKPAIFAVVPLLAAALVSFCLGWSQAEAETDSPAWIGAMGGLSVPSADHTSARSILGLTAGAKLGSEYGLGVYYLSSHNNESLGHYDYDLYGVELGYHFEGEARGAYFGGRLGTSKVKVGSSNAQADASPFHWGLFAGYNHMIGDHFSVGGEANFMSISKADNIDGFTTLNFMLTAKFWL